MPASLVAVNEERSFWKSIYACRHWAIRFVKRNRGNKQDGEDVFQNACVLIHLKRKKGLVIEVGKEKAYFRRVVRLMWMAELRFRRRAERRLQLAEVERWWEEEPTPNQESHQRLVAFLKELNNTQRNILIWGASPNTKDEEVAEELGFRSGQVVRQSRYRLIKKMRKYFANFSRKP